MPAVFRNIPSLTLSAMTLISLMISGCHEANTAIDFIVGKKSPAELFADKGSFIGTFLAPDRGGTRFSGGVHLAARSGALAPLRPKNDARFPPQQDMMVVQTDALPELDSSLGQAALPAKQYSGMTSEFTYPRDPFRPPLETVPPTECLPSMPLCRYDYTKLKLRGLIRLANGQYKGMVEDPEGRGFFITPGVQIRGATVTQVTADGVILYIHKTKKVDWLRIEGREAKAY